MLSRFPTGAAAPTIVAVMSWLDALNCVILGHDDWWFPATVALLCANFIRKD